MKISNKIVTKFQEGGAVPAGPPAGGAPAPAPAPEGGAPAPEGEGGGDPIMQMAEIAMQALETQDCQAAMAVCEAFISMLQPEAGAAPAGGAPAPEGAPVFKKGGILVARR